MNLEVLTINHANSNDSDSAVVLIKKNINKNDVGSVQFMQSNIKNGSEKKNQLCFLVTAKQEDGPTK
jgi:hypothetical protein